jgi:hypothetical protein
LETAGVEQVKEDDREWVKDEEREWVKDDDREWMAATSVAEVGDATSPCPPGVGEEACSLETWWMRAGE